MLKNMLKFKTYKVPLINTFKYYFLSLSVVGLGLTKLNISAKYFYNYCIRLQMVLHPSIIFPSLLNLSTKQGST